MIYGNVSCGILGRGWGDECFERHPVRGSNAMTHCPPAACFFFPCFVSLLLVSLPDWWLSKAHGGSWQPTQHLERLLRHPEDPKTSLLFLTKTRNDIFRHLREREALRKPGSITSGDLGRLSESWEISLGLGKPLIREGAVKKWGK